MEKRDDANYVTCICKNEKLYDDFINLQPDTDKYKFFFEENEICDDLCVIADNNKVKISKDRFSKFWDTFFTERLNPKNHFEGFYVIKYFLTYYKVSDIENEMRDSLFSILFDRFGKTVLEYNIDIYKVNFIKLLNVIATISPILLFKQPGFMDSMVVIFLRDAEVSEGVINFFYSFFSRDDIYDILEDLLFSFIIPLSNYSPPSRELWRFLCFFFMKYSKFIEGCVDFDIVNSDGTLPIFTMALFNNIRSIQQLPPEIDHEQIFWDMWDVVFNRYLSNDKTVAKLYDGLINETIISIYFSLKSAINFKDMMINKTAFNVIRLLLIVKEENSLSSFKLLFGEILDIAISVCLLASLDEMRSKIMCLKDELGANIIDIKVE